MLIACFEIGERPQFSRFERVFELEATLKWHIILNSLPKSFFCAPPAISIVAKSITKRGCHFVQSASEGGSGVEPRGVVERRG